MKKAFAAALALSLAAGTSALAQERHDGDNRRDRVVERQHQQQVEQRQEAHRQQAEETRPARPVPQVVNPHAQEVIAAARARQAQHDAVVVERRDDHANEAIAEARARQTARREDQQRMVVPHVTPPAEQRRYDRRDNDDMQHVFVRPDARRDTTADRRAEVERRLRDAERNRDRNTEHWSRPGDHQLRDRDRNRHWFNPDQYRPSYWAQHRYRVRPYHRPSGWYVRTWIFGDYLPHGWYNQTYYLDWWSYGLPRPPIGAEWVRVGDDALLVDTWSGEVLSVYYDLFW